MGKKRKTKKSDKDQLREIKEVDEEEKIDDKIWGLDEEDAGAGTSKKDQDTLDDENLLDQ